MHGFEVHSNESACRKKVRLGMEQVGSGRCRSPKGATGSGFAGLCSWHIFVGRSWPCRVIFHAKAVVLGTRTINRIVPRCLRIKTYRTILILRRIFCGKPDDNQPTRLDGVVWMIGADCSPKKVLSSRFALCGASGYLFSVELGHTRRSYGRRPRASLRRSVRITYVCNPPMLYTYHIARGDRVIGKIHNHHGRKHNQLTSISENKNSRRKNNKIPFQQQSVNRKFKIHDGWYQKLIPQHPNG